MNQVAMPDKYVTGGHRDFTRNGKPVKVRLKTRMPGILRIRAVGNEPPLMSPRTDFYASVALSAIRERDPNTDGFRIIVAPQSLIFSAPPLYCR